MNDVEQTNAIVRATAQSVAGNGNQTLSVPEVVSRLNFIKQIMQEVMQEGQDYGVIPGCGKKPSLLQPGAQKLCLTFQLNSEVREEKVGDLGNHHREYALIVRVSSPGGKYADGVGTCSTLEGKYRFRDSARKCPTCGEPTIANSKAEYGGGYYCNSKRGGCGAKFEAGDLAIVGQSTGKTEHDNPADYWNTVRKMAFKRGMVAAAINFTNTSQLWSQDLEDISQAGDAEEPARKPAQRATDPQPTTAYATGWRNVQIHFGKNANKRLGDLGADQLRWYCEKWMPKDYPEGSGKFNKTDMALRGALDEAMAEKQQKADGGSPDPRS